MFLIGDNMLYLAPSILSADFSKLGEEVALVEQSGLNILHIDVMDGQFVPSISYGVPIIKSIRKKSSMLFDVHMMVQEPGRFIKDFAEAGADSITVHAEACQHLHRTIYQIKENGKKCCVALNPTTPLDVLDYLYTDLDMILLMTVNPGYGGQKFIPAMLSKIKKLHQIINDMNLEIPIEVDGGINVQNVLQTVEAGAEIIVAGSSIYGKNTIKNIDEFRDKFNMYRV